MDAFISGRELASRFYSEIVKEMIDVPHSAALLGEGSEVLGYDQQRSTDHSWGPRLQIFVDSSKVGKILSTIEGKLPTTFMGYPVRFYSWKTQIVQHHVEVTTLGNWLYSQLRVHRPSELTAAKWLSIPQQHLLQITAGTIFRDDLGTLEETRKQLSWYPLDIWLWMMASQWHLIGNTQHLLGRVLEVPDLRGASLISSRMVRLMMELSFLQERQYWPYLKWFGTAFSRLNIAPILGPILDSVLRSSDSEIKYASFNQALKLLGDRHNSLGLTAIITPTVGNFRVGINNAIRPYKVINAREFTEACKNAISDDRLIRIPLVGSIDQLTHADDLLINYSDWPQQLEQLYQSYPTS